MTYLVAKPYWFAPYELLCRVPAVVGDHGLIDRKVSITERQDPLRSGLVEVVKYWPNLNIGIFLQQLHVPPEY